MSANGTRTIVWAGGEHDFCLAKVGHILDLEAKCNNSGIGVIAARLESGAYYYNDIRETIRIGLIGGGMAPDKAMDLVRNYVDGHALAHCQLVAYEIVKAVIYGVPDDPVGRQGEDSGKSGPAEAPATGSSIPTDASDAPN